MLNCWGLYGGEGEIGFSERSMDRIYMIYRIKKGGLRKTFSHNKAQEAQKRIKKRTSSFLLLCFLCLFVALLICLEMNPVNLVNPVYGVFDYEAGLAR